MAGFRKIYTSQTDYLKDLATSTGLFSETEYARQVNNAQGDNYLAYLGTLKDNISSTFDWSDYNKLADEDKFGYIVHKHSKDTSTEDYKQNEAYYNQKLQEIKNDEIYASLNGFQKTMATLGGWVGDMALAAYGTLEGLINVGATLVGGVSALTGATSFAEDVKDFIAQDTTGVTAAKNALANWRDAYTFENQVEWLKVANEVSSAIGQMAPMIIGAALTPVTGGASLAGTVVYYAAMAGQTAEQAIRTNPDINYAKLYGYTLGSTALEIATEWASGKIFGEGLIGVAGINKNAMTGSILKNIGHNMFTEGMEEAVSELFGSLLEWSLVTDFDENSLPTIENILYAAMIGSLTGGLMAGGRVALTTRMGVNSEGNIVRLKDVAKENRKNVKKLGLGKSWAVQSLLQQSSEALSATDNMTKLQAKYGSLNLQQIQEQHADEYQKAYDSDVEVKEQQAKTFLALSKLMNTIGATKFTQSVELLNNAVEDAKRMADNYINHTATANKKASEVFAANFPDKSFTPTAIPSKQNQTLAETIRQIFPGVKIVFGKFGSKDGSPVRAMDGAETYIFVDEAMVDKKGYKTVLRQAIRYQLADQLMEEMNILDSAEADAIVELFTDSKLSYSALDTKQKLTIAQMLCFDPVNTRKLFGRNMKTHKKIFKYITDNAAYVKKFGRQTEANKMRYHDLLGMRNMYLQNIADTIGNAEDIAVVENEYGLTPEETKTKLVDKTRTTVVNDVVKLTDLKQSKQAIQQREAFNELNEARVDTTTPFDFDRMWDKDYYNPEFVASITQTEPDFKKALQDYILRTHNVTFAEKGSFVKAYSETLTANDVELMSKALLTKEYLDSNPSFEDKKTKVIDALYIIKSTGVAEKSLQNVDTIIEENNQIQGTGKLKFLKVKVDERNNIYNDQQQGRPSEGTREQVGNVVTKSTTIANKVTINEIDESSYNDRLREIVRHAKREYGANVHFYSGSAKFQQANIDINDGLNGFVVGIDDIYLRYDETTPFRDIEDVLLHEGTHILITKDPNTFKDVRNKLRDKINERVAERNKEEWMDWAIEGIGPEPVGEQLPWDKLMAEYSSQEMYGDIYDKPSDIEEELVVDLLTFRTVTKERSTNGDIRNIAYEYYATTKDDTGVRRKYATKTRNLSDVSFEKHDVWDRVPHQQLNAKYAVWKQSTLDKLIERFGRWDNDSYTGAYVAYINPVNFVANSTQGALERKVIRQGLFEPDNKKRKTGFDDYDYMTKIDETVKEDNVPRFWINTDTMEITSHEGRHRNYTFDINNIENVPVLLIVDKGIAGNNPLANRMYKNVTFKGQQQSITEVDSPDAVMFGVMVPLNESHRTELEKMFVKGDMGEPKIRFAKDNKKQPKLANQILKQFDDVSTNISETQFSESNSKEYSQVSYDMIDTMADTFALVNDDNYQETRDAIAKSNKKYSAQALEIFDLYTIEMVGKFNKENQQKIENNYQKLQTEAGQRLALQAKRVATRKPISHTIATLQRDGFNTTVTDELVQKYDAKLKDKDAYIKELEQQIKLLEEQLKNTQNDIDKTALNKQLKEVSDKKGVIQNGSNADILDHIITHASTLEQASKLQEDILDRLVSTAVKAQEDGKQVGFFVYGENGEPKAFPKASEKLAKTLKKLKSFRMWAMLSSPVTWVRNWVGNQGMRSLDAMTNFVEGFISSRTGFDSAQMKFTETRAGKELYQYIAEQNEKYIMSLVRGEDVKYETSTEKAADIKRQERKIEYDSANAFRKACLKAQDMTDWGLSTGVFGDEPVVFQSICKNMGNLVANNIDFLLQGIQVEADGLSKRTSLSQQEQSRLDTLNKALTTKDAKDVFNALSKEETERLFDVCKERSFQQYFKNPNALSKWFAKFGTKHPVYAELVSWVMPFPKVAANVLSMAYRYSPLSFFKGLAELSKYKQTQDPNYKGPKNGFEKAQMIRTFSEATVGTFMLIAGAIFSAMGLIDIDEDDYMGPCLKMGDFKVSLSDLAPSMTTFSTASAVVWAWKNNKTGVTQALNVLYDNTLLGNVENLLTYGSFTDIAKNVSISYVSQYIPAILKLVNKGITGDVKKDKSGAYLLRLIKTIGSYIPGVSALVPNKIDPYTGDKVYQAGTENWFLNLLATLSPLGIKWEHQSEIQRQAAVLGAETSGLSGSFKINDIEYDVKDKQKYSKYRAEYINEQFSLMSSGKQKVTVEDEKGKRITTTYDKLTDKQKKNVINRLYTEATSMTKIKWWTDQGNTYVVTDRDLYNEYRKMFSNIVYKKNWSKSKFVES